MKNGITTNPLVLLSGESPHEHRKHIAGLVASLQPRDYYEECLVQEFADAAWVWRRARAVESAHLHHVGTSYYRGSQGIAEALFYIPDNQFRNHRRYMLDGERRYEHARRAVEHMHRRRDQSGAATIPDAAEAVLPEGVEQRVAAVARAATAKERNEPEAATRCPEPPARPSTWRDVAGQNEPNRPSQMPGPARRGDRAIHRFLQIIENNTGTDTA